MLSETLVWLTAWLALVVPPSQPVAPLAGGTAKAAEAMATIIAAITRATVNTKSMRLIDATSFTVGRDSSERTAALHNGGGSMEAYKG